MPKVTEEHTEARRRQILSAALACFAREGFNRATMQDIFREADLSPGAVYTYFTGKDELIEAIVDAALSFAAGAVETLKAPGPDGSLPSPGAAVRFLVSAFKDFDIGTFDQRTRIFPQIVAEAQRSPHLGDRVCIGLGIVLDVLADLARAAQERGEIASELDPEGVARLTLAGFHGFLIQHSIFGDALDQDSYVATAAALLDGRAAPSNR